MSDLFAQRERANDGERYADGVARDKRFAKEEVPSRVHDCCAASQNTGTEESGPPFLKKKKGAIVPHP